MRQKETIKNNGTKKICKLIKSGIKKVPRGIPFEKWDLVSMYFRTLWISPLEKQYVYNMDVGE